MQLLNHIKLIFLCHTWNVPEFIKRDFAMKYERIINEVLLNQLTCGRCYVSASFIQKSAIDTK